MNEETTKSPTTEIEFNVLVSQIPLSVDELSEYQTFSDFRQPQLLMSPQ